MGCRLAGNRGAQPALAVVLPALPCRRTAVVPACRQCGGLLQEPVRPAPLSTRGAASRVARAPAPEMVHAAEHVRVGGLENLPRLRPAGPGLLGVLLAKQRQ